MPRRALWLCPLMLGVVSALSCNSSNDRRADTTGAKVTPAPPRAPDDAVAAAATQPAGRATAATNPTTRPQKPQEEVSNPKSLVRPEKEKP